MYDCLVVGAGFAGSSAARLLAESGCKVLVLDQRPHVAGNAYDEYDANGVLVHRYGPHIFHTNSDRLFQFLSRFTEWLPYEHRVLAMRDGKYYEFPINRRVINEIFNLNLSSDKAVEVFLDTVREQTQAPRNAEEYVVAQVGRELYEKFFHEYTKKQWGVNPRLLSKSVTARIPYRCDNENRYFTDRYQGMPRHGYTLLFQELLEHSKIDVSLSTAFEPVHACRIARHIIYTGPVDAFYDHRLGYLPYRSLRFEHKHLTDRDWYQPVGTVNHPTNVPYTRVTEFKRLTGQRCQGTSIVTEFPQSKGMPFYPMPTTAAGELFRAYQKLAQNEAGVTFVGRLAEFRYYNMDQACAAGINAAKDVLKLLRP